MKNSMIVGMMEGQGGLPAQFGRETRRNRRSPVRNAAACQTIAHDTKISDELGERLLLDEPHRVKMNPALRPNQVDGNNVGVVEQRGGLGLDLESFQLCGSSADVAGKIFKATRRLREIWTAS